MCTMKNSSLMCSMSRFTIIIISITSCARGDTIFPRPSPRSPWAPKRLVRLRADATFPTPNTFPRWPLQPPYALRPRWVKRPGEQRPRIEDQTWHRGRPRHTWLGHHFLGQKVKVTRLFYSPRRLRIRQLQRSP